VRISITSFVSQVHNQVNREVEDIEGLNKKLEEGERCLEATVRELPTLRCV
jgi:hypothetical protein